MTSRQAFTPITDLEKAALITTGAGAAYKVLLWSLGMTNTATGSAAEVLRIAFAILSFVAFDLVLFAVVVQARTSRPTVSGVICVLGAALASAGIALDVAGVVEIKALSAAPVLTMLLFVLHLMFSSGTPGASEPADPTTALALAEPASVQPVPSFTQAVQVNLAPPALPPTVAEYIVAQATALPHLSRTALAAQLRTSPDTVRRALETPMGA